MSNIVLLENDQSTAVILTTVLKTEGYKVVTVASAAEAASLVRAGQTDLVLADIARMPDDQRSLLAGALLEQEKASVILISDGEQDVAPFAETGVIARMKKPLKMDDLLAAVQRALDYNEETVGNLEELDFDMEPAFKVGKIVAESSAMRGVCEMIHRVADADVTVLLCGERGTGRGLVARTIHEQSPREKFFVLDCSSKDADQMGAKLFGHEGEAGMLKLANGGSLYLSEVDEMPGELQEKLLGILQSRGIQEPGARQETPIDVRVFASAVTPDESVKTGHFTPGLYRHLRTIVVQIPPLRERPDDIAPLVTALIQKGCPADRQVPKVNGDAIRMLKSYSWPGNVGQLEDVVNECLSLTQEARLTVSTVSSALKKHGGKSR
ncbi:MAG: sigma-54-dependent Fis family transcriptional regulator [Lentisphaerales bacterium]|jgi:two-component system NtrC family response regulator|nr:MAG: sigma-54-dependent Fis family transcriptional regulator [Lentisphaerales bacterium]